MARLSVAFFCSGFAALLCQVVWQRMLGIFAGSDTVSAALVVGAFLAGLGLGSMIGAALADRLSPARALVGFALAEIGVAAFALGSKAFLYDWLATDLAGVIDAPALIFALCFAGLALPTILMGASLPLLSRAVAARLDEMAGRVSRLYALNTLGAGMGALLGGWLLVGSLGFVGALTLAAGINVAASLLALTLLPALDRASPVRRPVSAAPAPFGGLPLWCLLVFLSGYVIVALEIVWVRVLGQVGQYHAYLFPTVLGIFLLADGLGIEIASRILKRVRDPRPAFFITQSAGFVLAAALVMVLWWALPLPPLADLISVESHRLQGLPLATMVGLAVALVAPPSLLIGMTFPFVQRAVQQDLASVGSRVGWVQVANIAGNAAGSIGTGLVTLHWLGTAGTLKLLAGLSLLLLLGWLWHGGWRRHWEGVLAAGCLVALVAMPGNAAFWSRLHNERPGDVVAWSEDRSGVAFFRGAPPEPGRSVGNFFIQGFSQGAIPFMPFHQLLGSIGPLLHPDPREVLVIGVGSGGTPWAAGVLPQSRVRGIELVAPVLEALADYAEYEPASPVARMLRDPRWRLEYGDGRRLLARENRLYDVIEQDAILPEGSHSGMLYSEEFLAQVRRRLAPGGLYVQWAPTARVVETFVASFPHAVLLLPGNVLIGSESPIQLDRATLAARYADPAVRAHLAAGNVREAAFAEFISGEIWRWGPSSARTPAPLSDVHPRDEFYLNNPTRAAALAARP